MPSSQSNAPRPNPMTSPRSVVVVQPNATDADSSIGDLRQWRRPHAAAFASVTLPKAPRPILGVPDPDEGPGGGRIVDGAHTDACAPCRSCVDVRSSPCLLGAARLLTLAGCASMPRVPFTKEQQAAAAIPGIPNARVWSDDRADGAARAAPKSSPARRAAPGSSTCWRSPAAAPTAPIGAGLLAGWSERGTRPRIHRRDRRERRRADRAVRVPRARATIRCCAACSPKASARNCCRSTASRPCSAPACSRPSRSSG